MKCPECGIPYDSRREIINHFTNDGVHPYIRDYFKTENSYYRNPVLGEFYKSYIEFRNSWYEVEPSMTDWFLDNFSKLPDESTLRENELADQ